MVESSKFDPMHETPVGRVFATDRDGGIKVQGRPSARMRRENFDGRYTQQALQTNPH